jgi:Uma2 family endonuclease
MKTRLFLTRADHARELSMDEFLDADAEEGFKYEIIEGRLDVSPVPGYFHSSIQLWLLMLLNRYAEACPAVINHVNPTARIFLPGRRRATAPEPDLAAFRDFPLHLPASEVDWRDVSPLLVVEVISPETADKDLVRNRRLYLRVPSIREYWIIDTRGDLDRPSLIALRRAGRRWAAPITVPFGGTYTTPLLPGFSLVVRPA